MQNEIKISVLMPSYNVVQFIDQCLYSIRNQSLKEIEILCIDAGSTDGTLGILLHHKKNDSRIRIINSAVKSYGFQLNTGLKLARGEYISILETDDFLEPEALSLQYTYAKQHNVDIVKSNYYEYREQSKPKNKRIENLKTCIYNKVFNPFDMKQIFFVSPSIWSGIFKRSMLLTYDIKFNETPGASYQDTSFWFMVCAHAKNIFLTNDYFLHYRRDNINSSTNTDQKVFCICDEAKYIETYIDVYSKKFITIYAKFKLDKYMWNYKRISQDKQWQFLLRFREEFEIYRGKEKFILKEIDFSTSQKLYMLLSDHYYFFKHTCKKLCTTNIHCEFSVRFEHKINTKPLISICILEYHPDLLTKILTIATRVDYNSIEIICFEDNIEREARSNISALFKISNRTTLILQNINNIPDKINLCISRAKGIFILFLHANYNISTKTLLQLVSNIDSFKNKFDMIIINQKEAFTLKHIFNRMFYHISTSLYPPYKSKQPLVVYDLKFLRGCNILFQENQTFMYNTFLIECLLLARNIKIIQKSDVDSALRQNTSAYCSFVDMYANLHCLQRLKNYKNSQIKKNCRDLILKKATTILIKNLMSAIKCKKFFRKLSSSETIFFKECIRYDVFIESHISYLISLLRSIFSRTKKQDS